MNEHSRRLMERILNTIKLFESEKVTLGELERDVIGVCNALEEKDVAELCKGFVSKINDAMYLYNDSDGRHFLLQEIKIFKECLNRK